jgi:hypothetical protein
LTGADKPPPEPFSGYNFQNYQKLVNMGVKPGNFVGEVVLWVGVVRFKSVFWETG